MFHSLLPVIVIAVTAVAAIFAFWKGDPAARIAGVINFINAVALPMLRMVMGHQTGEVLQLAGDFVWAVGLLMLVVRYASLWLGVTMLLQAVQFSLHAYYLVLELPHDLIHAWINNLDEVGISICIITGTVLAIRRRMALAREAVELEARRQKTSPAR
jgi:hypothetical protein